MKIGIIQFLILFCLNLTVHAESKFPRGPDPELTPGSLCDTPDTYKFSEKIPYCERDVDSNQKWVIIYTYMRKLDFRIDDSNRKDFKIDHFIPLCLGGSNKMNNLWPQHKSLYKITDSLEILLCQKLANGKITQDEAIRRIKDGKLKLMSSVE